MIGMNVSAASRLDACSSLFWLIAVPAAAPLVRN
jgi:hypothetical protein